MPAFIRTYFTSNNYRPCSKSASYPRRSRARKNYIRWWAEDHGAYTSRTDVASARAVKPAPANKYRRRLMKSSLHEAPRDYTLLQSIQLSSDRYRAALVVSSIRAKGDRRLHSLESSLLEVQEDWRRELNVHDVRCVYYIVRSFTIINEDSWCSCYQACCQNWMISSLSPLKDLREVHTSTITHKKCLEIG